jgi:adenine-specific DNA-methyltransferase
MKQAQEDFTLATEQWLKAAPLGLRQSNGQYMTPSILRTHLLDRLDIFDGARILDPGVGTGEFLRQAREMREDLELVGWDIDPGILSVARENVPGAKLENRSALDPYEGPLFDFVIGNPPYFEMKPTKEVRDQFESVISGRANIYALFFQVGLSALKPGGVLAYVVPPSMNAGAYFKGLRNFICEGNAVEYIKVFTASDLFHDAQTSVQIIVIRKGSTDEGRHVLRLKVGKRDESLFFEDPTLISELFDKKQSLWDLGYEATTGTVVWNQFKDDLNNLSDEHSIPLYYPRNLENGMVQLKSDPKKPQYLNSSKPKRTKGPAVLVNRIIGGVGKGQISAALVLSTEEFFAENHLNVIRARADADQKISLEKVFEQINRPETLNAARLITGNTQLSATEWNYLIPFSLR